MRLAFAFLVLLAVAAGGLLLGPRLLDLGAYRSVLAEQLTVLAGRRLEIAGPVRLVFVPRPALRLDDVRAADGGFTAERIEIDPRWGALLEGKAEIRRARLIGVAGRLDAVPEFRAGRLPLDEVGLIRSRFVLAGGALVEVRDLRLRQATNGALRFDGQMRIDGRDVGFDAVLDAGRPAPFNGRLTLPGSGEVIFTGALGDDGAFRGRVDGKGSDLGAITAGLALLPSGLPWQVGGAAEFSAHRLALNDMRLVVGDATSSGALSYETGAQGPRLDIALQLNRIDLDRLAGTLPPWPAGLDLPAAGNVDIGVAAATWRGGIVQQIRLEAGFAGGGLDIDRLAMLLPGAADLNLSGRFAGPDTTRRFSGRLDAAADNLRATLEWLGADLEGIAADRLRRLQFTAGVELDADIVELTDLELRLDASRQTGVAAVALRSRPSFSFDLDVDTLNVDGYWPHLDWAGKEGHSPLALLGDFDSNMKLSIARFTLDRMTGRGAEIDARLFAGTLKLESLRVEDLEGSNLGLAGEVRIAASGVAIYQVELEAGGRDIAGVARHLGVNWPGDGGRFTLAAQIDGDPQRILIPTLKLGLAGESASGSAQVRFDATPKTLRLDLTGGAQAIDRVGDALAAPQDMNFAGEARLIAAVGDPRLILFGLLPP